MRYIYKIRPMDKEQEIIEAMSYKKMLKKLVLKFPKKPSPDSGSSKR